MSQVIITEQATQGGSAINITTILQPHRERTVRRMMGKNCIMLTKRQ